MNVTLTGVEELNLFPTPESRERAITEHAESVRGWDLLLGIVICIVVAGSAWVFARWALLGALSHIVALPKWFQEVVTFGTVAVCMFIALRILHRWGVRRHLRTQLIAAGVPVCMRCGYLLRGLTEANACCPECGAELEKSVRTLIQAASQKQD